MWSNGNKWKHAQELMGCDSSCRFCDVKALGKGPCCTFPGRLVVNEALEKGGCMKKRGVSGGLFEPKKGGRRAD